MVNRDPFKTAAFPRSVRIILILSGVIWVACWFVQAAIDNTYVNYPRIPLWKPGMTESYFVKNITVFISKKAIEQIYTLRIFEMLSGCGIFFSFAIGIYFNWKRSHETRDNT